RIGSTPTSRVLSRPPTIACWQATLTAWPCCIASGSSARLGSSTSISRERAIGSPSAPIVSSSSGFPTGKRQAQMADQSLDGLRERIRQIDLRLLECAAERVELARQVGEIKRREKRSTADYAQERVVLERARAVAKEHGLDPGAAADLIA